MMKHLVMILILMLQASCAYKMGYGYRNLPKGMKSLYVPMFTNATKEVGPEVEFTNQLVKELSRAKVAKLVSRQNADGILEGRIVNITRVQRAFEAQNRTSQKATGMVNLPPGTFVATEYTLRAKVELVLKKPKSGRIVWKQWFSDDYFYTSARLALKGINTATPNYTASEEERVIKNLAGVMMQEAVGRLVENF